MDSLYLTLPGSGQEFDLYVGAATVQTWDVVDASFDGWDAYSTVSYNETLMNALRRWTVSAELLGTSGVSAASPNSTSAFFTLVHGTSSKSFGLADALNRSIWVLCDAAAEQDRANGMAHFLVLAVSLSIFGLLATAVIAPATSSVAHEKHLLQVRCCVLKYSRTLAHVPPLPPCQEALLDVPVGVYRGLVEAVSGLSTTVGVSTTAGDAAAQAPAPNRRSSVDSTLGLLAGPSHARRTSELGATPASRHTPDTLTRALSLLRERAAAAASRSGDQVGVARRRGCFQARTAQASIRAANRSYRAQPTLSFALLLMSLLLPLAVYCLVFVGAFLWRTSAASAAAVWRADVTWSREMELFAAMAAGSGRFLLHVEDPGAFALQLQRAQSAVLSLQWAAAAVLNGDAYTGTGGTLAALPVVQTLWKENGCVSSVLYLPTDCAAFGQGVVAKGLSSALGRAAADSTRLWNERANLLRAGAVGAARALLGSAAFQDGVRLFWEAYLPAGLAESTQACLNAGTSQLQDALSIEALLAVFSIVALCGGHVLLYERRIRAMDAEIKHLREVMLL